jgi:N utilization substance protein B
VVQFPRRRRAREVVLQVLYGDDLNPRRNQGEVADFIRTRLANDTELVEFANSLLSGVRQNRAAIDVKLLKWAEHWSLERMSATDRNVLRLGTFEFLFDGMPAPVAIDEALELARRYGTRQSALFVNGVLGRIYKERCEEIAAAIAAAEAEAAAAAAAAAAAGTAPDGTTPPAADASATTPPAAETPPTDPPAVQPSSPAAPPSTEGNH